MRIAHVAFVGLVSLAGGCMQTYEDDDDYYNGGGGSGWGSGWGGTGGYTDYGCATDAECGNTGLVCARTHECLSPTIVRVVSTSWTPDGAPASTTTCSNIPKLSITFSNTSGEEWGYTPVPCDAGKFTVDKFPTRFTRVQLSRAGDYGGGAYATFSTDGTALIDLPY